MTPELRDRICSRLGRLYGQEQAPALTARLAELAASWQPRIPAGRTGIDEGDALLITYADSLVAADEAPLQTLRRFLRREAGGLLTFVHLLPFYPYSSDDGFAVEDFRAVREGLGDWADVRALAAETRLCFDAVINHVSASSAYLRGYLAGEPAWADFFIALPPDTDTSAVLRTRNLPLLHEYQAHDGPRWLWTTFSADQVDLNFANPEVLFEILDVLLFHASQGAAMLRLDAIPYLWKELGTSCAHLPQTHEIIKLIRDVCDAVCPHVLLLTETNVPHRENVSYVGTGGDEAQVIYNFSLPPLIVWSLYRGDAGVLTAWARQLEWLGERATYLNITATHDGIGMRPTEGILSAAERQELCDLARERGGDITGKRNPDGSVSPYELNLSYWDAVNDPAAAEDLAVQVRRFLTAQAIPMALMGLPGIYIHSLLGSANDLAGVARTGRARSINREQLRREDLEADLADPASRRAQVFAGMQHLLRVRRRQRAFHPDAAQTVLDLGPALFAVRRVSRSTGEVLLALSNVTARPVAVTESQLDVDLAGAYDVLTDEALHAGAVALAPWQTRWVRV